MIKKLYKYAFVFTAATLMGACGNNSHDESENKGTADSATHSEMDEASKETPITYSLPSPLQIAKIFKKSGLSYTEGVTNPVSNLDKYSSNISKAVNLGVYSGDLSYCVLNKQSQPSLSYMKAVRQLADKLGMGSVFEVNNLGARFEKNIGKDDSLASIIAELQMQTDLYLEDNEQQHISAIVFAGAWMESMYIGAKVYDKEKNNAKLTKKITEQMTLLENIVNVLIGYQGKDENIKSLVALIEPIRNAYKEFPEVKKVTDEGEGEIILTPEQITSISSKVVDLRNKFVNNQ